jgi:hypothetical protein
MIIWTGWGILAGLIWVGSLGLTQFLIDWAFEPGYYTARVWPKLLASVFPAPFIWLVGRALNGSPHAEERRARGARHTFFLIPMEYWAFLFILLGVIVALVHQMNNA